jgi:hypothetical protein
MLAQAAALSPLDMSGDGQASIDSGPGVANINRSSSEDGLAGKQVQELPLLLQQAAGSAPASNLATVAGSALEVQKVL